MLPGMTRDDICSAFLDQLTFSPYPFQEEALLAWFEENDGVLVTAPTGMGKTLIAEAAIFEALKTKKRLYYTTPLIALTDQKFREFRQKVQAWGFHEDDVGLVTGNRRVNPDAPIVVAVAEILLNHLLSEDWRLEHVAGVVMDEFHYFNDFERGVVWELTLVLLPKSVRLMLLSATVGNAVEFTHWLKREHGRALRLVQTNERKVPLEFHWVGDKLMTEHLPQMVRPDDEANRAPALVFCFNRDECWEVAERMKGLELADAATRKIIEADLPQEDFKEGIAPKLRQMLIRGVGVHHAGVLPKHKEKIEDLFLRKLVPFVICTETLAAGINLPARSVVLGTLLKGKRGEKKLVESSTAHQIFGRAGRPQFDLRGYVYVLAHEDDARIAKWQVKFEQIDPKSKDPGIMRARKQMEKKRPRRRSNEQYWSEGQFKSLIEAGPGKLASRSMIPYQVLIFLLNKTRTVAAVREFLKKRFNDEQRLKGFQSQLDHMIGNMAALGYLTVSEDGAHVELHESIKELVAFRSIDPLFATYAARVLVPGNEAEKLMLLESVLEMPPAIARRLPIPYDLPPGPVEINELRPLMIQMGKVVARTHLDVEEEEEEPEGAPPMWREEPEDAPLSFPEMVKVAFDAKLPSPEEMIIQPKWAAGAVFELENSFYKFIKNRNMEKNEGLVLRHLLRLAILAGEFYEKTQDPAYREIVERATNACRGVDPSYTARFLANEAEVKSLVKGAL